MDSRPAADPGGPDTVVLRVPCSGPQVRLVRRLAASLGARVYLTIDELDDLRTVVHEAAVLLSDAAEPGATLTATFHTTARPPAGRASGPAVAPTTATAAQRPSGFTPVLSVALQAPVRGGDPLPRSGFAWLLLSGLADELTSTMSDDGTATVSLSVRPTAPVPAVRGSEIPSPRAPGGPAGQP